VVLVEDLHWIDAASEEFVEALADAIVGTTTMLVVNFRTGFAAPNTARRRSGWTGRARPPKASASFSS
jgi:adenylate cyclase